MLILAGVSLNAIIGDNGIITNAQDAKMKNGMAVLEEFLQEKYVENYEKFEGETNKVARLRTITSLRNAFYSPAEDNIGSADFVTDSYGHALYLINKEFLPQDISDALVGGNCGIGKSGSDRYVEFASLLDVYGVTSDLIVYYFSPEGETIGISSINELDSDTTTRPVLASDSALGKLINGSGTALTVAEAQAVKILEINDESVKDLSDIYALNSLEELTITNMNLKSLDGIQNAVKLKYIFFKQSMIEDYSALTKLGNKLEYLYFYGIDDNELETFCSSNKGVRNANFTKLKYFAVAGSTSNLNSAYQIATARISGVKYITSLDPIGQLAKTCVQNIEYLTLASNEISDTLNVSGNVEKYALENLKYFENLCMLKIERNDITSFKGIKSLTKLVYIFAEKNNLGVYEEYNPSIIVYDENGNQIEATDIDKGKDIINDALVELGGLSKLKRLYLAGNINLKWVSYIKDLHDITHLYFGSTDGNDSCFNMVDTEVASLRNVFKNCTDKSYPPKYWLAMLDADDPTLEVSIKSQTLTQAQFESLGTYSNIYSLDMTNIRIIVSDEDDTLIVNKDTINSLVNNTLKNISGLKRVFLVAENNKGSLNNLDEITFLKGVDENDATDDILLTRLMLKGTNVSTHRKDSSNEWNLYANGLKLLVTKRVGMETFYGQNLNYFSCSEAHINLSEINSIVQQCGKNASGLIIESGTVMSTISNCTGLTDLYLNGSGTATANINLTSTNNPNFSMINVQSSFSGTLSLPSSCNGIYITTFPGTLNVGNLSRFKLEATGTSYSALKGILSTVSSSAVISRLNIRTYYSFLDKNDFSMFKEIYEEKATNNKYKITVEEIKILASVNGPTAMKSLNGFEYLTGLKKIEVEMDSTPQLSDISCLTYHEDTLETLILPKCSISNAMVIKNLEKLTTLDLMNNCLAVYIEYDKTDENGNVITNEDGTPVKEKWFTIKEISDRLRSNVPIVINGTTIRKATLKLAGNSSIVDWSGYTSDTSEFTNESTYGN